jgi:hypothetical protein
MSDRSRGLEKNRTQDRSRNQERSRLKAREQSKSLIRIKSRERQRFLEIMREDGLFDDDVNDANDALEGEVAEVDSDVQLRDEDAYIHEADSADVVDADGILDGATKKTDFAAEVRDEIVVVRRKGEDGNDCMHCVIPDNQYAGCRPKDDFGVEGAAHFSLQKCRECYRKIATWLERDHQEWLKNRARIFPLHLKNGEKQYARTGAIEQKWFCKKYQIDHTDFPYFIRSCCIVWQDEKCALPLERLFGQ